MKRKIKLAISLLFVMLFLVQLTIGAFAEKTDDNLIVPPPVRFTNISNCYCSCYISGITLYANATMTANRSMYLSITIELQKLSDGSYSTIKTWSDSKTGVSLGLDADKLINIFSTYRIKVTYYAGGETHTAYDYA